MLDPYLLKENREFDARCKDWYRLKRWIGTTTIKRCENGHDVDDGAIPDFGPYFREGHRWDEAKGKLVRVSDSQYVVRTKCPKCNGKILPQVIRYVPGIVERCFTNTEFKNSVGQREEIPLLLPPYALGCLFTVLYTGDISPTGEKNSLIIQPRSTYKTLVVSIALFLYTVNNHQDRNVMFVVEGLKQSDQTLQYLTSHFKNCRYQRYQEIIKKHMQPVTKRSKDKGVHFMDGSRIVVYVTYSEKVAETLRSFHGSFIFVDECAMIQWKYIMTIKSCLNAGGRIVYTTTPKVNDWTKEAVISIITNKSVYVDGDDNYIRDLLANRNIDPMAYRSWSLVRIPIKEVIENLGQRPHAVARPKWTSWEKVEEELANANTPSALAVVRSDLFLEWSDTEGGLLFPNGLKEVYTDYIPGVDTIDMYTKRCAGLDFATSDCNTVLSIFGLTSLPNGNEIIRLIHVERIFQGEYPHEQMGPIIDTCVRFGVHDLVFDNQGPGSTVYGMIRQQARENPELLGNMRVHAGGWGNIKIKSNDYDTLKILESTKNMQIPEPSFLMSMRNISETERKQMLKYASEIRNANEEFLGLSWKYINNKTTLAVKKPKYADYPDSFAFAVRFLVSSKKLENTMSMTTIREQKPGKVSVTDAPVVSKQLRWRASSTREGALAANRDVRQIGRPTRMGSIRMKKIYERRNGRRDRR